MKDLIDYRKSGYMIISSAVLGRLSTLTPYNCWYRDIKTERIVGGDIYISNEERKIILSKYFCKK